MKDCNNVKSIKDVNELWGNNIDDHDGGENDRKLVSCGQIRSKSGDWNELKEFYKKHYSDTDESDFAKAVCKCCKEVRSHMNIVSGMFDSEWDKLKKCLKQKGILTFEEKIGLR